jgi:hypothetical protein
MERADLRSRGRPSAIGLKLVQGKQMVQPPVAPTTQPRPKLRRNSQCSRPHMDK